MAITSEITKDKKSLTINVAGRFDFSTLPEFKGCYEHIDPKPEKFIIDLSNAEYLDSSALGMLLALRDYAGGDDAKISINNCNDDIRRILVITKFDELFEIN